MALGVTYFAGNEVIGFSTTGTVTISTNSSTFRPAWSRSALQVNPGTTADPPSNFFVANSNFTSVANFWFHAMLCWSALGGSAANNVVLMEFLDPSGTARLAIRGAGSGAIKISTRNNSGTFVDLATSPNNVMPTTGLAPFPIDVDMQYGTSGFIEVWLKDVFCVSFSGDTTTNGATQLANFRCANCNTSDGLFWSEELVSSVITINAGVFTLAPVAPGTTQQWAGTASDINGVLVNDTLFISDGSAGDLSGWTTPTTLPTGAWAIQSIVQEARSAIGNTGPTHFDWYIAVNSSDNLGGASNAPALTFGNFSNFIWADNPHTSAPWAVADLTTLNLGVKSLA
jgi:hypothetical protein